MAYWLCVGRRKAPGDWLEGKFSSRQVLAAANPAALNAGHAFGETSEMSGMLGGCTVRAGVTSGGCSGDDREP